MTIFNYALGSLGAVGTADSEAVGFTTDLAFDGSDVTGWRNLGNGTSHYLYVDLGAAQYITDLVLTIGAKTETTVTYTLDYSLDAQTWNYLGAVATAGNVALSTGNVTGRYFRLRFNTNISSRYVTVLTFACNGPIEAPPPPTNPTDAYIAAWLDGLEANYVPAVQDWLEAN